MKTIDELVTRIRKEMELSREVPNFDPKNGNENARILFVLEAPGAKAIQTGYISFDNPDQTAKNFRNQIESACIDRSEIAIWNIVPWYLGDGKRIKAANVGDITLGLKYLGDLIKILKKLEYIVLVGSAARRAHVFLSYSSAVRILGCHHPSPKVVNNYPEMVEENISVFRSIVKVKH